MQVTVGLGALFHKLAALLLVFFSLHAFCSNHVSHRVPLCFTTPARGVLSLVTVSLPVQLLPTMSRGWSDVPAALTDVHSLNTLFLLLSTQLL